MTGHVVRKMQCEDVWHVNCQYALFGWSEFSSLYFTFLENRKTRKCSKLYFLNFVANRFLIYSKFVAPQPNQWNPLPNVTLCHNLVMWCVPERMQPTLTIYWIIDDNSIIGQVWINRTCKCYSDLGIRFKLSVKSDNFFIWEKVS